jgi:hypothetical protein
MPKSPKVTVNEVNHKDKTVIYIDGAYSMRGLLISKIAESFQALRDAGCVIYLVGEKKTYPC